MIGPHTPLNDFAAPSFAESMRSSSSRKKTTFPGGLQYASWVFVFIDRC
jgi:hypothetical protein